MGRLPPTAARLNAKKIASPMKAIGGGKPMRGKMRF